MRNKISINIKRHIPLGISTRLSILPSNLCTNLACASSTSNLAILNVLASRIPKFLTKTSLKVLLSIHGYAFELLQRKWQISVSISQLIYECLINSFASASSLSVISFNIMKLMSLSYELRKRSMRFSVACLKMIFAFYFLCSITATCLSLWSKRK